MNPAATFKFKYFVEAIFVASISIMYFDLQVITMPENCIQVTSPFTYIRQLC